MVEKSEWKNSNDGSNYIFVGGSARSGTTLVQNILDSHPDIFAPGELNHVIEVMKARRRMLSTVKEHSNRLDGRDVIDQMARNSLDSLLLVPLKERGMLRISEKTPRNILVFEDLYSIFPKAKYILVMRDPRAVISSLLDVGKKARESKLPIPRNSLNLFEAVFYLSKSLVNSGKAIENIGGDLLTIYYEELVEKPTAITKIITDFLELQWSDEMERPGDVYHEGVDMMTEGDMSVYYDQASYQRNVDRSSLNKWKKNLKPWQQVYIQRHFEGSTVFSDVPYDFQLEGLGVIKFWADRVRCIVYELWVETIMLRRRFFSRIGRL
ncbi:MAG TPA: sulfotransferase [bacterium]|nr:sulfotransferase [bacterium]